MSVAVMTTIWKTCTIKPRMMLSTYGVGRADGHREGFKNGHTEGHREGHKEACLKMARRLLDKNMSIEDIATLTDLSHREIANLSRKDPPEVE